jgi:hypothetical protein
MRSHKERPEIEQQHKAALRHAVEPGREDGVADVQRAVSDRRLASPGTILALQRLGGNAGVGRLLGRESQAQGQAPAPSVSEIVNGGSGQPLEAGLRSEMEARLGADFSTVQVHGDERAGQSARAINANAYTVGEHVVLRGDRVAATSPDGKQTLAHELTHVLQQRAGPVAGTARGDGTRVSHPSDAFERAAQRSAEAAMSGPAPARAPGASVAQREADEDEEETHQPVAQREADEDEEETHQPVAQREADEDEEEKHS